MKLDIKSLFKRGKQKLSKRNICAFGKLNILIIKSLSSQHFFIKDLTNLNKNKWDICKRYLYYNNWLKLIKQKDNLSQISLVKLKIEKTLLIGITNRILKEILPQGNLLQVEL